MVHFLAVTTAQDTPVKVLTHRGDHVLYLADADKPAQLKAAQPQLQWGTSGGRSVTVSYGDFASLVLAVMHVGRRSGFVGGNKHCACC